jgi:hypothetical protein
LDVAISKWRRIMGNEYLLKEYELCFEQLRFYDKRQNDLSRYLFTLASAVATAQFTVFKFPQSATTPFYALQAVLSFVVFVATLLLYVAMLQNRLYFVFMARQINALRGYLMVSDAPDFKGNQLYTSVDFPAFRMRSLHAAHFIGTSVISSVFASATAYSLAYISMLQHPLFIAISVFVLVAVAEVVLGMLYLKSTGQKSSDQFLNP